MKYGMKAIGLLILTAFLAGACAPLMPPGPSISARPGTGKTAVEFSVDDDRCRNIATARAGNPAEAAQQTQWGTAILTTLALAALGAASGAIGGEPGLGAAVGASAGALGGTIYGASAGEATATAVQRRWDNEYWSCMYNVGHLVPGVSAPRTQPAPIPPPPPPPASAPSYAPPPTPPTSGPSFGPPPAAAAPAPPPSAVPCKPSGKWVKTPQGFVETCD